MLNFLGGFFHDSNWSFSVAAKSARTGLSVAEIIISFFRQFSMFVVMKIDIFFLSGIQLRHVFFPFLVLTRFSLCISLGY